MDKITIDIEQKKSNNNVLEAYAVKKKVHKKNGWAATHPFFGDTESANTISNQ